MLRLLAALVIAAFAFASSAPPAQAIDAGTTLSAAKKKQRHAVRRSGGGGQIACTIYGCQRIPRRCTPTTEFDFWGNPTGFDAVACR